MLPNRIPIALDWAFSLIAHHYPVQMGLQLASSLALERLMLMSLKDLSVALWAIAQQLKAVPTHRTSFAHLCQSLGMSRIEVCLGVLLGEFEQGEEFYSHGLWVKEAFVDAG